MKGKTYVLSDIHGNFEIFKRMLDKIQFNSHDQLYILGDICDRGPCSLDIYFYIQKFDNITLLKGNHEYMMQEALKEAKKAYNKLEVPVGAVIVKDGKIIARGYNQKETKTDTTKHAEIIAIQKASQKLKSWRLLDCEMYVTLEPCSMCAGAIINSRIKKVYYGTSDNKTGAVGSVLNLFEDFTFNHKVEYEKNIMQTECENILKQFFKELRKNKNV